MAGLTDPREPVTDRLEGDRGSARATRYATNDQRMDEVLDRLGRSESERVLVSRDGELVGIITRSDLAG